MLDLLTDLHRQGRTIVMVTHNPALGQFADVFCGCNTVNIWVRRPINMRWHNVLLLAAAILISGCKEEKLAVGAPAPALAVFDLQGQESGLDAGKERRCT